MNEKDEQELWGRKIQAFFHDPPDKALLLFHKAHENKGKEILEKLNIKYLSNLPADGIAAAMQRINIPEEYRMEEKSCEKHICFKGRNKPEFKHTISATSKEFEEINKFIDTYGYEKALETFGFDVNLVTNLSYKGDLKRTYFSIWRLLPDEYPLGNLLPADTRIPDHNIWDHLDVTTAIAACLPELGLLSLKIPEVQEFISQSRKLSDLWAASYIYSFLLFEGIKKIIDELGPDVIIFPHLRDNPLVDWYLQNELKINKVKVVDEDKIKIANLPNTFTSFIPYDKKSYYEKKCKEGIKEGWKRIANKAKEKLKEMKIEPDEELWDAQIENAFSIVVATQKFFNWDSYDSIKDSLPNDIKEKQETLLSHIKKEESNYGHFYLPTYVIVGEILAQKSRIWDAWKEEPVTGKKCIMCGRRNAIVERVKENTYKYWNGNWNEIEIDEKEKRLLKEGERLCSVCLVKRIYPKIFKEEFKVEPSKFGSVVEIAARKFIKNFENDEEFEKLKNIDIELVYKEEWNLKEKQESKEKQETSIQELGEDAKKIKKKLEEYWNKNQPNKYYGILMMDGDKIGKMLSGETLGSWGEFFHPAFKENLEKWVENGIEKGKNLAEMKRILSPSVHIAISRSMKDFSIYKVPEIVGKHDGFLVYSGGDDVLALFPTDEVLETAKELQDSFREDFYEIKVNNETKTVMGLGKNSSMSAGIVIAHYKWPLYDALEKVREAVEKAKKEYGRKAFYIVFIKRSGKVISAGGKWDCIDDFNEVSKALLQDKISNRFIYDFLEAIETLGTNEEMLKAEIKRLLKRRKDKKTSNEEIEKIYEKIEKLMENYRKNNLPIEDVGKILKILFDANKGVEK